MTEAASVGLRRTLHDALPLFASLGFLMAGNGLTSTLLGFRSALEGFSPSVTGVVLAAYYLGFFVGSLTAPSAIRRVGHIRVFAGLASLASCAVILHVVHAHPVTWFLLRALSGLCTSGLYVVTEAWLNGTTTNATRGGLLAGYMVVVTGGLGVGQLLFAATDPAGPVGFVVGSVLVSLAVVPVSLASVFAPEIPDPQPLTFRELSAAAPLAPVTGAVSGFTGAAMVGAGAIYASSAGLGQIATAALLLSGLAGGLALQMPLGRWSDRTDRRVVILAAGLAGAVAAAGATVWGPDNHLLVVLLSLLAGGIAYPLYSLASAHLNDYLDSGRVVAAGARMILVNAMGAVAGPVVGAVAIQALGPSALFVVLGISYLGVSLFAGQRIRLRAPAAEDERSSYLPVPLGTGPIAATLVTNYADELYPVTHGAVHRDDGRVEFTEQGNGPPVILLGDQREGVRWDRALSTLAAAGFRAIVVQFHSTDQSEAARARQLFSLLRQLDLATAALVGMGSAAGFVSTFAAKHPERADCVVLVGAHEELEPVAGVPSLLIANGMVPRNDPETLADTVAVFLRGQATHQRN
ncbi:MAG TPA: MFS transporter [Actinomycetota bacterium]|nr:MFS transporter [Actinomycetota bacterium]